MDELPPVTIQAQIAEVELELRYRARVYGRLMQNGRMTVSKSQEKTRLMEAVLETLRKIERDTRLI